MRYIAFDTETRNRRPIRAAGTYHYAETAECLSAHLWMRGKEDVMRWDILDGGPLKTMRRLLSASDVRVVAHNAMFDRTVAVKQLGWTELADPRKWVCTAALARYCGLPGSLGDACKAVNLPTYLSKMDDSGGIRTFTGANAKNPTDDLPRWKEFMRYGDRDAKACLHLLVKLRALAGDSAWAHWMEYERRVFWLDQLINENGFAVDRRALDNATGMVEELKLRFKTEVFELTGGEVGSPQSPKLRGWLNANEGLSLENLQASTIEATLRTNEELSPRALRLLELRQLGSKNSLAKYKALAAQVSEDGRVRAGYLYHGAHTGRWAGQAAQPQNLARPVYDLDPVEVATMVSACSENPDDLSLLYDEPLPDVLMSGIRGALCPGPGRVLVIGDYANIEARIIAWLAGAQERLEAIARHDAWVRAGQPGEKVLDLYELTARDVLGDELLRQQGKMLELGLGFGMGFRKFATINGLDRDTAEAWVDAWRTRNRDIYLLWRTVETWMAWSFWDDDLTLEARLKRTLQWLEENKPQAAEGFRTRMAAPSRVEYLTEVCHMEVAKTHTHTVKVRLPNGKPLFYHGVQTLTHGQIADERQRLGFDMSGTEDINEDDEDMRALPARWRFACRFAHDVRAISRHGGFLTENWVQGIARELEASHMLQLHQDGMTLVNHSHDEVVVECDAVEAETVRDQMTTVLETHPSWLPKNVPLRAEVTISERYTK